MIILLLVKISISTTNTETWSRVPQPKTPKLTQLASRELMYRGMPSSNLSSSSSNRWNSLSLKCSQIQATSLLSSKCIQVWLRHRTVLIWWCPCLSLSRNFIRPSMARPNNPRCLILSHTILSRCNTRRNMLPCSTHNTRGILKDFTYFQPQ